METTFMSIHNLSPDANILFASESIVDILGYQPHEVTGRSCFDYFHPDEVPFARDIHNRGVKLDKAAVLNYARIKGRDGQWVDCECVFTIVHDVLVACTSTYSRSARSEQRAVEAPGIRRLFSASPKDPRYHMLEHLSAKFKADPEPPAREPRAALVLNRFTRTLTIMFATNAVTGILGVTPDQINGKSFYECIHESCLADAIRCLESAKANDSIAYLRFWYRDPRRQEDIDQLERDVSHSSDSEDGGVGINDEMDVDQPAVPVDEPVNQVVTQPSASTISSGGSSDHGNDTDQATFDHETSAQSHASSSTHGARPNESSGSNGIDSDRGSAEPVTEIEIEAVVSCTSDGLVVILRRARPMVPADQAPPEYPYPNGMFAAPWGAEPIFPQQQHYLPEVYQPEIGYVFHPDRMEGLQATQSHIVATGGPRMDEFMNSIREVAVFAWSLTGINGNIATYGRGTPRGESIPPNGFPIYDPHAQGPISAPPVNQAYEKWVELHQRTKEPIGESQVPFEHARQEQLLRQQLGYGSGPMGSDLPGSTARIYLGHYIGEDGRGPSYHPYARPHYPRHENNEEGRQRDDHDPANPGNSGQGHSGGSNRDRYLWY